METNITAIRNEGILHATHAWEAVKAWAGSTLTRNAIFDAALAVTAFGSAGFVLLSLHRIVTNWTMTGF